MKLAALFSGGKDSTAAIWLVSKEHEVVYLTTVLSKNADSYMYHSLNISLTELQAEAMGIPLVTRGSEGRKEEEVEDLKKLLSALDTEGIVCGAIASQYQKERVEKVCNSLGLKLISPLWHIDEEQYLRTLVKNGFEIIITGVFAEGLDESWLGRKIDEKAINDLLKVRERRGINIAAEGGEFETAVLDCPLFRKRISVTKFRKEWDEKNLSGKFIIEGAELVSK